MHHPRLEGRVEDTGGNASQDTAKHEDPEVIKVLGGAGESVQDAKQDAVRLAPKAISQATNKGADNHGRAKANLEKSKAKHGRQILACYYLVGSIYVP